jgi:hypothetical protein
MRALRREPIGQRWTADCSALLERLNAQGLTDGEIARAIEARTGLRFSRRWIAVQRKARQIGACWNKWEKR